MQHYPGHLDFNPFPPFLLLGSVLPGGWTLTWLEVGGVSGCLELLLSQHLTATGAGEAATELCRWKTQRRRCSSEHPCGKDPAQQRLGGVRASFRAQHCLGHREHGQGSATLWEPWSTCKSLGEPPRPRPFMVIAGLWAACVKCHGKYPLHHSIVLAVWLDALLPLQQGKGFSGRRLTWSPIVGVLR